MDKVTFLHDVNKLPFVDVVDAFPEPIALLSPEKSCQYVNKAWCETFSISRHEVIGKLCFQCLGGLDAPPYFCPHLFVCNEQRPSSFMFFHQKLQTAFRALLVPLPATDGRDSGFMQMLHKVDDTEIQEELSYRDARLEDVQRIAKIGYWDWDIAFNTLKWSAGVYRLFGIQPKPKLTFKTFLDCIHPEDRSNVQLKVKESLENDAPYYVVHRIITLNGDIRYMQEWGEVTRDSKGRAIRMIGTVQDITEQKLVIERLAISEERLRTLLDASPDFVCFKDGDGRWLEANKADIELFELQDIDYHGNPPPVSEFMTQKQE
ncbi:MAG: PAS domain-containing protein [Clostridia bacterium]|nr:PAS domain-containing protein [Clostridia bacterium]